MDDEFTYNGIQNTYPFAVPKIMFLRISHVSGLTSPTSPCSHWSRLPLSTYSYTSILHSKNMTNYIETVDNMRHKLNFKLEDNYTHTCKHPQHSIQAIWQDSCAVLVQLLPLLLWIPSQLDPWEFSVSWATNLCMHNFSRKAVKT